LINKVLLDTRTVVDHTLFCYAAFHEASGDDDVDYGANYIRRSSVLYESIVGMCPAARSNFHRTTHPFGRRLRESSLWAPFPEHDSMIVFVTVTACRSFVYAPTLPPCV
jgi:hypothetical protein